MAALMAELGLGIGFTLMALIPMMHQTPNDKAKIRVQMKVGLEPVHGTEKEREEQYSAISYGGNTPNIVLFNAHGDRIAWYWNKSGKDRIEHNSHGEIFADWFPNKEGQTPEYMTMSASWDDSICITHGECVTGSESGKALKLTHSCTGSTSYERKLWGILGLCARGDRCRMRSSREEMAVVPQRSLFDDQKQRHWHRGRGPP